MPTEQGREWPEKIWLARYRGSGGISRVWTDRPHLDDERLVSEYSPYVPASQLEAERVKLAGLEEALSEWHEFGLVEAAAECAYENAGDHPRAMSAAIEAAIAEGLRQAAALSKATEGQDKGSPATEASQGNK